jgi:hypothetical protein
VEIKPFPVIQVAFVTSTYDALTGAFVADGFMRTLDEGEGRVSYPNPKFRLSAYIDNAGNMITSGVNSGGSFSIDGDLLGSTILLGFAYIPGTTLEFLFDSATGSLVSDGTYNATEPIDVMFGGAATSLPGSFTTNFQSTTYSSVLIREDPRKVPEPSTLVLMLMAAGGATFRRFRPRHPIGPPQMIS